MNDRTIQWFQRRIDQLELNLQVQTRLTGDMIKAREELQERHHKLVEGVGSLVKAIRGLTVPARDISPNVAAKLEDLERDLGL
jgi:hypothetical protein